MYIYTYKGDVEKGLFRIDLGFSISRVDLKGQIDKKRPFETRQLFWYKDWGPKSRRTNALDKTRIQSNIIIIHARLYDVFVDSHVSVFNLFKWVIVALYSVVSNVFQEPPRN